MWDFIIYTGSVIGALTVILLFIKKFGKSLTLWVKKVDAIGDILQELKPNAGKSIRDVLDRVESKIMVYDAKNITTHKILLEKLAPCGFFELDKSGLVVWTDKGYYELTGLIGKEALGNGWMNSVHSKFKDKIFESWEKAVQQKRDFHITYMLDPAIAKEAFTICASAKLIRTEQGEIIGWFGTVEKLSTDSCGSETA